MCDFGSEREIVMSDFRELHNHEAYTVGGANPCRTCEVMCDREFPCRCCLAAEVERLTAALADERRHADALADTLYSMDGLQSIDCEMRDNAVQQHRARRQG